MRLSQDSQTKLAIGFLILAIFLLVAYQADLILIAGNVGFLEPDNYEYYLFSSMSISQHTFNVSNPYLVFPSKGFFEHPGLYQLPVYLHYIIPALPLIWDFRIIYGITIAVFYIISLCIAKLILDNIPINKSYHYMVYALILLNFLMMQQTQIIEWRGNTFILTLQLLAFYMICLGFIRKEWGIRKRIACILASFLTIPVAYYMWDGWIVSLVPMMLIPIFLVYGKLKDKPYWLITFSVIIIALAVSVFYYRMELFFTNAINMLPLTYKVNCFDNPLQLGEVQCLDANNGIFTVAIYLLFLGVAIWTFLRDTIYGQRRDAYEYVLIGMLAMILMLLPLAMTYLRMLQIIAPYLAIGFSIGIVAFFAKSARGGVNKVVMFAIVFGILTSNVIALLIYWQNVLILYYVSNPPGIDSVAQYLSLNMPNSTVMAFYPRGGYLEVYGHVKVYVDTIQELSYAIGKGVANFYMGYPPDSCNYLSTLPSFPDYILMSNTLLEYSFFSNASNKSIAKNPLLISECNYTLIYQKTEFYLFKRG